MGLPLNPREAKPPSTIYAVSLLEKHVEMFPIQKAHAILQQGEWSSSAEGSDCTGLVRFILQLHTLSEIQQSSCAPIPLRT